MRVSPYKVIACYRRYFVETLSIICICHDYFYTDLQNQYVRSIDATTSILRGMWHGEN